MPHLSVIVPAHNSQNSIEACLKAIRRSTYREYELVVVDDGSRDATVTIAGRYADTLLCHRRHEGSGCARNSGTNAAQGEILVYVDSDVLIGTDTLHRISDYFRQQNEIEAVTGMLAEEHPNKDFFSQYKNLYMHYAFLQLPERVRFLYGSLCAIRRQAVQPWSTVMQRGVDTELGQRLVASGNRIAILKNVQVVHLKRYCLASFVKNDFLVPFSWAQLFLTHKGWGQLEKGPAGFAHCSKDHLLSILLIGGMFALLSLSVSGRPHGLVVSSLLFLAWVSINLPFFLFLTRKKGSRFGIAAFFVTFIDHGIMGLAILCGFLFGGIRTIKKREMNATAQGLG